MFDHRFADAVVHYGDHIHAAQRHPQFPVPAPGTAQAVQPSQLFRTHRLEGVAVVQGAAGFYLCDDQGIAVQGNDVDLALRAPPIAFHHQHAQSFKEAGGEVLAAPAQKVF